MKGSDEFDILSAVWILSCNDENPMITYEGIKYRLGLPEKYDLKALVQSHGELFRQRVPLKRLNAWKQDMLSGKRLPLWIRDIENESERKQRIEALKPDDAFRSQFRTEQGSDRSPTHVIEWGLQHLDRRRKALIEDREQASKRRTPVLIALVTAVLTLVSTVVVSYLNFQWGVSSQLKLDSDQKRRQAFGDLMGRKFLHTQLYVSRFEAFIHSDYHEARWRLAGAPKESIDLYEAQRWMRKSEDLVLEIAKSNQSLFETIGLIRGYFPNSSKLDELTNRVYRFKILEVRRQAFGLKPDQLETWKLKAIKDLQQLVEDEYAKPIDELLDYLSSQIAGDVVE